MKHCWPRCRLRRNISLSKLTQTPKVIYNCQLDMGQNQAKPASKSKKLRNFDIGYCKFFNRTDHSKVGIHFFVFCLLQMQRKNSRSNSPVSMSLSKLEESTLEPWFSFDDARLKNKKKNRREQRVWQKNWNKVINRLSWLWPKHFAVFLVFLFREHDAMFLSNTK